MIKLFRKMGSLAQGITTTNSINEVAKTLETLKNSGRKVSVTIDGDKTVYTSSVSAFNAEHKVFVLDQFYPAAPQGSFRKGKTLTVTAGGNGQTINLESKYMEPLFANDNAGYQMQAPQSLEVVEPKKQLGMVLSQLNSANSALSNNRYAS